MTSKMIQAIDWKILECNKLLKFDDVGEENFESVVRDLLCELVPSDNMAYEPGFSADTRSELIFVSLELAQT